MIITLAILLAGLIKPLDWVFLGRRIGSTAGIPTKVSKSAISADFNLTSRGESQPNEGVKLTSNSHGFNVSSIKISKPKSSEKKKKINK